MTQHLGAQHLGLSSTFSFSKKETPVPGDSQALPFGQQIRAPSVWLVSLLLAGVITALGLASVSAQEVHLQLDEYHRLLTNAEAPKATPTPPAAPFALEQANLSIVLGETTARITTHLVVSIFATGWQEIPLATSGQVLSMTVRPAGQRSQPLLEARLGAGGQKLLARGLGRHEVVLDEAIDLSEQTGATRNRRDLALLLPEAASVSGSIQGLSLDQVEVVSGGAITAYQPNRQLFVGVPGKTLRLRAQNDSPVAPTADLPLRFSATVLSELHLWRTHTTLSATVSVNVLQGALTTLEVTLPEGYQVQQVDSENLSGWDVDNNVLTAELINPQRSKFAISLRLDATDPGEPNRNIEAGVATSSVSSSSVFTSPVFNIPAARRTQQIVGTTVHGAGILDSIDTGSAVERDTRSRSRPFGAPVQSRKGPSSGNANDSLQRSPAYQLGGSGSPPQWRLVWPDQTEVLALRVDSLVLDTLLGAKGSALVNLVLDVSNRGSQNLEVELPVDFRLVRAERDGNRIRPGKLVTGSSARTQKLVLPLDGGTLNHRFSITGVMPTTPVEALAGTSNMVLQLPSLNAPVTSVSVRAQLPDSWRYRLQDQARVSSSSHIRSLGISKSLLKKPPGFIVLHAAWSAMSSQPGALEIKVLEQRNREEWF